MNKTDFRTAVIALLCSIIVVGIYHFRMGLCHICKDDCRGPEPKPILVKLVDAPCSPQRFHRMPPCGKPDAAMHYHHPKQIKMKIYRHNPSCPAALPGCPIENGEKCQPGAKCPHKTCTCRPQKGQEKQPPCPPQEKQAAPATPENAPKAN